MRKLNWKRLLSGFLAAAMLLPAIPLEVKAADTITITATISTAGTVPLGEIGGKPVRMAQVPVTVTDHNSNGKFEIDDALYALHETYYTGGAAAGYGSAAGSYGLSLTKLWGNASGAFGYAVDNKSASSLADSVSAGDQITAFVYKDQSAWSDRYSYFTEQTAAILPGGTVTLDLKHVSYDAAWKPVVSGAAGAQPVLLDSTTDAVTPIGGTTDADGSVTLNFGGEGTYLVSATCDAYVITPPVCKVTVLNPSSAADYVSMAKENLNWSDFCGSNTSEKAVTENLNLPATLDAAGQTVSVSWSSSDTTGALSVYGTSAYVDRPASTDAQVTLTATLSYDGASDTKAFAVKVPAEGITNSQSVVQYGSIMQGIASDYAASSSPWAIMDMKAYNGTDVANSDYLNALSGISGSDHIQYGLAQSARGASAAANLTSLGSMNLSSAYAIYSIPYILLNYDACPQIDVSSFPNTRDTLIAAMADYLDHISSNAAGADEVAPILAALARYDTAGSYSPSLGISETNYGHVKTAVTSAVTWLSNQQNTDGTWSYYGTRNANSTALAVVALSTLGIDAHTDGRFIKNQKSAVEGLLSFALADDTGFGYKGNVTRNTLSTEQGFRALVAYARYKAAGAPYVIYTQADKSTAAVSPPAISVTGSSASNSGNTNQKTSFEVYFTLQGDSVHGTGNHTAYETWISNIAVTVEKGATAADAVKKVLDDKGYTYKGLSSGYISSITTPGGVALAEFTNGSNSGWMYLVNGKYPSEPIQEYTLSSGDKLVLQYVDDYKKVSSGSTSGMTTEKSEETTKEQATETPAAVVQFQDVTANDWFCEAVNYVRDKGLFQGTSEKDFSPSAKMTRAMLATVLYRLAGQPATASADGSWYGPAEAWARKNSIVSGYGDGSFGANDHVTRAQIAVMLYRYAAQNGYDMSAASDLSGYADAADVAEWARTALAWAKANGILTGRGETALAPNAPATRAEVATILMRFSEKQPKASKSAA